MSRARTVSTASCRPTPPSPRAPGTPSAAAGACTTDEGAVHEADALILATGQLDQPTRPAIEGADDVRRPQLPLGRLGPRLPARRQARRRRRHRRKRRAVRARDRAHQVKQPDASSSAPATGSCRATTAATRRRSAPPSSASPGCRRCAASSCSSTPSRSRSRSATRARSGASPRARSTAFMRSQLKDPRVRAQGVARLHVRLQAHPLQLPLPAGAAATQRRARHRRHRRASRQRASSPRTAPSARSTASSGPPASRPPTSCSRCASAAPTGSTCTSTGPTARTRTSACACPRFPNMFVMYGPNTNTSGGSIIVYLEAQAAYIRQALQQLRGARRRRDRGARRGRGRQRPGAAGALRRHRLDGVRLLVPRRARADRRQLARLHARVPRADAPARRRASTDFAPLARAELPVAAAPRVPTWAATPDVRLRDRRRRLGRLRARQPPLRGPVRAGAAARGRRQGPLAEDQDPGGVPRTVPHQARLGLRDRARAARRRALAVHPARQGARRLELDERDAVRARAPARLRRLGGAGRARLGLRATCCPTSSSPRTTSAAPRSTTAPAGRCASPSSARRARSNRRLLDASEAAGIPRIADYNGPEQDGASMFQVTQKNGRRFSAADAYLRPALTRPEPRGAHEGDGARRRARGRARRRRAPAQGPRRRRGRARRARGAAVAPARSARRSCCCCRASAPAEELRAAGVEARHELPGVGRNLQDHPFVTVLWEVSDSDTLYGADKPRPLAEWLLRRIGQAQLDRRRGRRLHAHARRAARGRHPVPHGRRLLRRPRRRDLRRPLHGDRAGARLAAGARAGVAALGRPARPSRGSSPTRCPSPTTSSR